MRREILARDRELDNDYTKDLQVAALRQARSYLPDKIIRVARAAQAHRSEGRPDDRGAAVTS